LCGSSFPDVHLLWFRPLPLFPLAIWKVMEPFLHLFSSSFLPPQRLCLLPGKPQTSIPPHLPRSLLDKFLLIFSFLIDTKDRGKGVE
jgi:hypothetical protein